MNSRLRSSWVLVALGLLLAASPLCAQTINPTNEGYDLMRQITAQQVKPVMLLVLDVSGSMAQDVNGTNVGTDAVGALSWNSSSTTSGCSTVPIVYKKYTYTPNWVAPSRMATVKNALGDTVTIYKFVRAPDRDPSEAWPTPTAAFTYQGLVGGVDTWTTACRSSSPGNPFDISPYRVAIPPKNLVGANSSAFDWGMAVFSTNYASCTEATLIQAPDTSDSGNVSAILTQLQLHSAGGQDANGSTPTRGALEFAKTVLQTTASGGTINDYGNHNTVVPADSRIGCGRIYGVILVTDGLSNSCNNGGDDNWGESCCSSWGGTPPCMKDTQVTETCPTDPASYPAGKAADLWSLTASVAGTNYALRARTFVIGVSPMVGHCELNYTAYSGHTDASAQRNDAGVALAENTTTATCNRLGVVAASCAAAKPLDCYLPGAVAATCTTSPQPTGIAAYDAPVCNNHQPPHGDYAYFALSSDALARAINNILAAFGAGDYTTSGSSVSSAASAGNIAIISSSDYPEWRGHIYAYDLRSTDANGACNSGWDCSPTKPCGWFSASGTRSNCLWDAGEILTSGKLITADNTTDRAGANNRFNSPTPSDATVPGVRRLYTWDPTNTTTPNSLVEITTANLSTINTICGCTMDGMTIDFIRGGSGAATGTNRWKLGPIMNSTPTVVTPPGNWQDLSDHTTFQSRYEYRHQLVWVGSSDGFMHALDPADGAEILAVMPPTMLKRQLTLYSNFLKAPDTSQTGQTGPAGEHIFGMANSPRYGDVYVDATSPNYRTLLYGTEGPGAEVYNAAGSASNNRSVFAIDITHPFPGRTYIGGVPPDANHDPCYGYDAGCADAPTGDPFKVVWYHTPADSNWSGLGQSWSVPAVAATGDTTWQLFMGGGFDPRLTVADSPKAFRVNAATGALLDAPPQSLTNHTTTTTDAWVRNQSFADSVFFDRTAAQWNPYNRGDEGIEADLQGHVWKFNPTSWTRTALFDLSTDGGGPGPEPIYYPPAVAAYPFKAIENPAVEQSYALYSFGSGTFYEVSRNINGVNTGTTNTNAFNPALYIGVYNRTTASTSLRRFPIKNIQFTLAGGTTVTLNRRSQLAAPSMIFTPRKDGLPFGMFLVFDPDANACAGNSYIVKIAFDPSNLAGSSTVTTVYDAGEGAASGFAVAGDQVIISQSHVSGPGSSGSGSGSGGSGSGSSGRAGFKPVPGLTINASSVSSGINWWRELQ